MPERPSEEKPMMPTIWRVPDELWERIEPILREHDPPKRTGLDLLRFGGSPSLSVHLYRSD